MGKGCGAEIDPLVDDFAIAVPLHQHEILHKAQEGISCEFLLTLKQRQSITTIPTWLLYNAVLLCTGSGCWTLSKVLCPLKAIFWPFAFLCLQNSLNSITYYFSPFLDRRNICRPIWIQNGKNRQIHAMLLHCNASIQINLGNTFIEATTWYAIYVGWFKGSYSTSMPCMCHVIVGLCCRQFHGPWKWSQQRPTKR